MFSLFKKLMLNFVITCNECISNLWQDFCILEFWQYVCIFDIMFPFQSFGKCLYYRVLIICLYLRVLTRVLRIFLYFQSFDNMLMQPNNQKQLNEKKKKDALKKLVCDIIGVCKRYQIWFDWLIDWCFNTNFSSIGSGWLVNGKLSQFCGNKSYIFFAIRKIFWRIFICHL